jgi:hypothetical protein
MRILYFLLKYTVGYALFFFYPRRAFINEPRSRFGRTIYVSNHAASFMDPISIGAWTRPIVFFMTRSDVFTSLTKPILWACHMLPIYRQHDGVDTKGKNQEVFRKSSQILKNGRSLLIFGEGFTDDTFIRRLKPVKKGAVRMGFIALESINWSKKIHIAGMGINYSDPNKMRSDYLISYSDPICLNDYKKDYEENPTKTITELTRRVEKLMQDQITHIEDSRLTICHEQIMILTRKGMNSVAFDSKYTLKERWEYSRRLAKKINEFDTETNFFESFRNNLNSYFDLLKRKGLHDDLVHASQSGELSSRIKRSKWKIILLALPMLIGLVHFYIPYHLAKTFAEKKFKRKVFWGSIKVVAGMILMGIYNIPFIFLIYHFLFPSWIIAIAYYWLTPFFGLAAYLWFSAVKDLKKQKQVVQTDISNLLEQRRQLLEVIQSHFTV